jgi:hypothetical protein
VKFLLLLHEDADTVGDLTDAERRAIVDQHVAFGRLLTERGARILGEALGPRAANRTIRFEGGTPVVTDGPYLEAKESIGGFYVLEAESMDAATELAKQVPRSPSLVAELLPIADM